MQETKYCSLAERQGGPQTAPPGAMQRQKRKGKRGGRWVGNTHLYRHTDEHRLKEWDGKLALAQDRAPSSGEPGEPRGYNTYQRTPGPKLGGKEEQDSRHSEKTEV